MHIQARREEISKATPNSTGLFVLKIWEEDVSCGHIEWRGEMLNVDSGQLVYFSDWPEMVDLVADALHKLRPQLVGGWQAIAD